jgi:hypothetical protein
VHPRQATPALGAPLPALAERAGPYGSQSERGTVLALCSSSRPTHTS